MNLPVCLREFSSVEFRYCKELTLVSTSISAHPPVKALIFPLSPSTSSFSTPAPCFSLPHQLSLTLLCIPHVFPGLAPGAAKPRVRSIDPPGKVLPDRTLVAQRDLSEFSTCTLACLYLLWANWCCSLNIVTCSDLGKLKKMTEDALLMPFQPNCKMLV